MSKKAAMWTVPLIAVLVMLAFPRSQRAQNNSGPLTDAQKKDWWAHHDLWNTPTPDKSVYTVVKDGPAPRHDLSGVWDGIPDGGTQPKGAREFPDDGKHAEVPYNAAGKAARAANKPAEGEEQVAVEFVNDPVDTCNPLGFPRADLFSLKTMTIQNAPHYVLWLNQYYNVYRTIWTDGRELPKDPAPRYYGYSVGHWADDYTFVVETVGMDERTWLDNVGRPHSDQLKVTETFHRASQNLLELTVTVDDPKFYTKPWVGMNKFVFHRLPDDYDMGEMICSPQEVEEYKKSVAAPVAGGAK